MANIIDSTISWNCLVLFALACASLWNKDSSSRLHLGGQKCVASFRYMPVGIINASYLIGPISTPKITCSLVNAIRHAESIFTSRTTSVSTVG